MPIVLKNYWRSRVNFISSPPLAGWKVDRKRMEDHPSDRERKDPDPPGEEFSLMEMERGREQGT
jgi:hypothetical protein